MITPSTTKQTSNESVILKEYNFNINNSKYNGGIVEGIEALKIWITKALKTERYKFLIYSWQFGNESHSLIGMKVSRAFLKTELKRYIEECLMIHEDINGIKDLSVLQNKDILTINFTVLTKYGEVNETV